MHIIGWREATVTTAHAFVPPSPAPWAEIVPGYGPVTVDILLTLPDDGCVYEVVEGVLVRVASPFQSGADMAAKARVFLRAGTRLVWRAAVLTGPARTLGLSDTLDGEDMVVGFSYAVSVLFANPLRQEPRAEPLEPA